ncbi:MAG: hypothetical protein FJ086_14775 [Deltaproteobacteria bacterium]|nr:hypothetical protein [Deltaproteobacteria bacterium]
MNTPRLESAEVRGFQLVLPRAELERLPQVAAGEGLQLAVSLQGARLSVTVVGGTPQLQFRVGRDGRATLEQVDLRGDERGRLLLEVLAPLAVRHGGDLHVQLGWNGPGQPAELRVQAGKTDYPGLLSAADEPVDRPLTAEEREVQLLLERAAAEWARYQQLKQKGR